MSGSSLSSPSRRRCAHVYHGASATPNVPCSFYFVFSYHGSCFPAQKNPFLEHTIGFNVSHDNEYIVMALQIRQPSPNPPDAAAPQTYDQNLDVTTIGVDVMKVALPKYEKDLRSFVHSISDTVRFNPEYCTRLGRCFSSAV